MKNILFWTIIISALLAACEREETFTVAAYYFPNYHEDQRNASYFEDGPFLERALDEGFLKAENSGMLKFGLMWANHDWVDIHPHTRGTRKKLLYPGMVSPERFDEICDKVIEDYFTLPNYWQIQRDQELSILTAGTNGRKAATWSRTQETEWPTWRL